MQGKSIQPKSGYGLELVPILRLHGLGSCLSRLLVGMYSILEPGGGKDFLQITHIVTIFLIL